MRARIIGIENNYYRTEEEAGTNRPPVITHQINAIANPDKTWLVSQTICMGTIEKTTVIARGASLTQAYNLVRNDEEHPKRHMELRALRQSTRPKDKDEYWRNFVATIVI